MFKELSKNYANLSMYPDANAFAEYFPLIITAVAVGASIICCIIALIIASLNYVKYLMGDEKASLTKPLILSTVAYFAAYLILSFYIKGVNVESVLLEIKVSLGGYATSLCVILPIIIAAVMLINLIIGGKSAFKAAKLKRFIPYAIAAVFTFVTALVVVGTQMNITLDTSYLTGVTVPASGKITLNFNALMLTGIEWDTYGVAISTVNSHYTFDGSYSYMSGIFYGITKYDKSAITEKLLYGLTIKSIPEFTTLSVLSLISTIFATFTAVLAVLSTASAIGVAVGKCEKETATVLGVFAAVTALVFFVLSLVYVGIRQDMLDEIIASSSSGYGSTLSARSFVISIGSAPIVAFIFSILNIITLIVASCLNKKSTVKTCYN